MRTWRLSRWFFWAGLTDEAPRLEAVLGKIRRLRNFREGGGTAA